MQPQNSSLPFLTMPSEICVTERATAIVTAQLCLQFTSDFPIEEGLLEQNLGAVGVQTVCSVHGFLKALGIGSLQF